jgi:hypothetical protein
MLFPARSHTLPIAAAIAVVGVVAAVMMPVLRELRFTAANKEQAFETLEQTRRRFAGQVPLIRVNGSKGLPHMVVTHAPVDAERRPVGELLVLAYDPHDGELVRTKVPLWVVRLGGWRNFVLRTLGRADLQVTVEDIERHGPGLIVDIHGPGGMEALMWAE